MICEINVESVVTGYFEVDGPENELGFAQNLFKSTFFHKNGRVRKTYMYFDLRT